jgi:hypothetical protein
VAGRRVNFGRLLRPRSGTCGPGWLALLRIQHGPRGLGHSQGLTVRPRPRVPPKLGPMAPGGGVPTWQHRRVGQQTPGLPGRTGTRDRALARTVGSTGGGDADPDTILACSWGRHRGGLFPLRRLTAIQHGRSWRRDLLAGRCRVRALCRHVWGATSQPCGPVCRPADAAIQ